MEPALDSLSISHLNLTDWQRSYGFSQAVSVSGRHTHLFLAGVGSEGRMGSPEKLGDVAGQCRLAWVNIGQVLAHAGGSLEHIVRVRTYVTDPWALGDVTSVRREFFGDGPYPVHTFVVVSQLAELGMLVEIEVDAVLPQA